MPIIQIKSNLNLEEKAKIRISKSMVNLVSDMMKKPNKDVMIAFSNDFMYMDNTVKPAVFIDFRFISGFSVEIAKILCEGFYRFFKEEAEIDQSRVYVNFFQVNEVHAWRFIGNNAVCKITNH